MSQRFYKTIIEVIVWTANAPLGKDGGWISRAIDDKSDNAGGANFFHESKRTAVFQLSGKEMAEALHKYDHYIDLTYYGLNEEGETIYSKATCSHCDKEIDVSEESQKLIGHPGTTDDVCKGSGGPFETAAGIKIGRRS